MRAVVYEDVRTVWVHEVPEATVEEDTETLVRVTSSALCGTDLHMYDRRTGATPGLVLGHEPLRVVERVGSAVQTARTGANRLQHVVVGRASPSRVAGLVGRPARRRSARPAPHAKDRTKRGSG